MRRLRRPTGDTARVASVGAEILHVTTVRNALRGIAEPTERPFWIRSSFGMRTPRSLRAALDGMTDPRVAEWDHVGVALFSENTALSEEAQGATTDGARWYVCSNNTKQIVAFDGAAHRVATYAPNSTVIAGMWEDAGAPRLFGAPLLNPHFGAPAHHQGWIHVPVQNPYGVWRIRVDGGEQAWAKASYPLPYDDLFPWCAVNPVTGVLYTCNFRRPHEILAYDRLTLKHRPTENIAIQTISVDVPLFGTLSLPDHVQGGVFTNRGRLILVCSDGNAVFCFSALNGHLFGAKKLGDFSSSGSEVESVTLRRWRFGEIEAQVHVLELDNDWPDKDDFYLHSFRVPEPDRL